MSLDIYQGTSQFEKYARTSIYSNQKFEEWKDIQVNFETTRRVLFWQMPKMLGVVKYLKVWEVF